MLAARQIENISRRSLQRHLAIVTSTTTPIALNYPTLSIRAFSNLSDTSKHTQNVTTLAAISAMSLPESLSLALQASACIIATGGVLSTSFFLTRKRFKALHTEYTALISILDEARKEISRLSLAIYLASSRKDLAAFEIKEIDKTKKYVEEISIKLHQKLDFFT